MAEALKADMGSGIYVLLSSFSFGELMGYVVFVNLLIFLITSADSASFFVAMQMSRGSMEPTTMMKLIWGGLIGSLALVLLVSGGLQALQKAAIIAGAPFSIIIFMMIFSLFRMLRKALAESKPKTA
jgi:glycine betaine transporter